MERILTMLGALLGASGVAMGAVAAHALPQRLDAAGLRAIDSAVQMQLVHALALVATALFLGRHHTGTPSRLARRLGSVAGAGFAIGTLLFCGAIYTRHLLGWALGPLAPVGGVTLIGSWLVLAAAAAAARR